jgi:iron-sulfur cluster assembly protein
MLQLLPVNITEKAMLEISNIFQTKGIPKSYGLRIGVRGGGCSGVSHYLGFDQKSPKDDHFIFKNINIYIEKKDMMHLIGITVDFIENEESRGFVFE